MSWPELTVRLRQRIVGLLDYESRCHLRICSKDDRDTVDSTKFIPKTLNILEFPSDMSEGKTIIRMTIDTFNIWFIGKENLTRIDRGWNGEIINEFSDTKQKSRYEVIADFLERISFKGFIRTEALEIDCVEFPPPATLKFKCNQFILSNILNNQNIPWLQTIVPLFSDTFKSIEIRNWGDGDQITGIVADMKISHKLSIDQEVNITDEQLEKIEAPDLSLSSTAITPEGAKKRLERFLKFGKKDDKLELNITVGENFNPLEKLVPKTLVVKKLKQENGQDDADYHGKIFGGYENVHGVHDPRELNCIMFGDRVRLYCGLYQKCDHPFVLYPL